VCGPFSSFLQRRKKERNSYNYVQARKMWSWCFFPSRASKTRVLAFFLSLFVSCALFCVGGSIFVFYLGPRPTTNKEHTPTSLGLRVAGGLWHTSYHTTSVAKGLSGQDPRGLLAVVVTWDFFAFSRFRVSRKAPAQGDGRETTGTRNSTISTTRHKRSTNAPKNIQE